MFRPCSDTFRGNYRLPGVNQNESLQKIDCCNMLSDCCQEVCSAIYRRFSTATGAEVRLWTRSGNLEKKSLSKIIITPPSWPQPDFRECVPSMIFKSHFFFAWRAWRGGPRLKISLPFFFYFEKTKILKQQEKVPSSQKVLL